MKAREGLRLQVVDGFAFSASALESQIAEMTMTDGHLQVQLEVANLDFVRWGRVCIL